MVIFATFDDFDGFFLGSSRGFTGAPERGMLNYFINRGNLIGNNLTLQLFIGLLSFHL